MTESSLEPIAWEDLDLRGELGRRSRLSARRLEDYTPEFTLCGNDGWPGDREGRAVLGQVLIGRAVHTPSAQTDALLAGMPNGMLGPPPALDAVDEQQLAGHSWLLRGLAEHYAWQGSVDLLGRIERILGGLFLPLRGRFAAYPLDPARRDSGAGGPAGMALGVVDGWRLSSDVGAAFLSLDGLTNAYPLCPSPELEELIEEVIGRFLELDPVAAGCQTHSTLTCLRALLRWHELRGRPEVLARAEELFDAYLRIAYTEQHHNWNWFGRPRWTEPCAVVDSFQVATGLWRATGNAARLRDAQEILFTGLARQRHNGGYGCDICTGALGQTEVKALEGVYEAHWCCTMRGAEGMARAAELCWCTDGPRVLLPWQSDSTARLSLDGGDWEVRQESAYPEDGASSFTVLAAPESGSLELALFAAPWVDREGAVGVESWQGDWALLRLPARVGAVVRVELPFGLRRQAAIGELHDSHVSFRRGPLLLGVGGAPRGAAALGEPTHAGGARYRAADGDELAPVAEATWLPEAECRAYARQVLFAD